MLSWAKAPVAIATQASSIPSASGLPYDIVFSSIVIQVPKPAGGDLWFRLQPAGKLPEHVVDVPVKRG
jgi:hypothetical protein